MRDKNEYLENPSLLFTDIADAIREKSGETNQIDAVDFPEKIHEISGTIDYVNNDIRSVGNHSYYYMKNLKSVEILEVNTIGAYAFASCEALEKAVFGNTLTYIGDSAFAWCYSLSEVNIPDTLQYLGRGSFANCSNLSSINIPKNISTIDYQTFAWSGLNTMEIPNNITRIEEDAFYNCTMLKWVMIPYSVESIGNSAFARCDTLESIIVDANNPNYTSDIHNVLYDKGKTIILQYPIGNSLKEYNIEDGVVTIGAHSFGGSNNLESVTIPNSVTTIGNSAFSFCKKLKSIVLPNSNVSIGEQAFSNCHELLEINLPDDITSLANHVLMACYNLPRITIPSSVTSIGEYALYHCYCLKDIYYNGTMEQWNSITFGDEWDGEIDDYTVHCIDGDITKSYIIKNITYDNPETIDSAVISTGGEHYYFKFTPTESGYYTFSSTIPEGEGDGYCYLYDAQGTQLASDDDSGGNFNFNLGYTMQAGTTYYYGVKYWDSNATGTIPVRLIFEDK